MGGRAVTSEVTQFLYPIILEVVGGGGGRDSFHSLSVLDTKLYLLVLALEVNAINSLE